MKKAKILPLVFFTSLGYTSAQTNTFPTSGNGAGLGTLTPTSWFSDKVFQIEGTRPTFRLAPLSDGDLGTVLFKGKFSEGIPRSDDEFHINYNSSSSNPSITIGSYKNESKTMLSLLGTGKVGVGVNEPRAFFDVGKIINREQLGTVFGRLSEGDDVGEGTFLGVRGYATSTVEYGRKSFALEHSFYGYRNSSINFHRGESVMGGFITFSTNDNSEKMRISPDGNVGIGITTPSEKLSVNGKIRAHEIKVETTNWPDYVFDQDYKILELVELERFIKINKHLPEMPSAKTVQSEGIAVGDMIKLQQKKIEELTLHLIEKDKTLKVLERRMLQIEKRLNDN